MRRNPTGSHHSKGYPGNAHQTHNLDLGAKGTCVLYIKMPKIYPLYKESIRKQNKDGLDQQTILSYMKTHKAYIGQVKSIRFKEETTSAYAFDFT